MLPFVFVVPLMPRAAATDWAGVSLRLGATLRSVLRQTDPAWRVVLACTDPPDLAVGDPRIEILRVPDGRRDASYPEKESDAGRKRFVGVEHAVKRGECYVMLLDADDLVSRNLVAHVRAQPLTDGFVVTEGYNLDAQTGALARLDAGGLYRNPFHQVCGSCACLRLGPEFFERDASGLCAFNGIIDGGHTRLTAVYRKFGRPLVPLPFPAVVRVDNTGDNISRSQDGVARLAARTTARAYALAMRHFAVQRDAAIESEFGIAAAHGALPAEG